MLALSIEDFAVELTEGSIKNVGAPNKRASAKLFDVTDLEGRAFGDRRVKVAFEDAEGNEVQVALDPEQAESLIADLGALREERADSE
jgi:hypothetical protein